MARNKQVRINTDVVHKHKRSCLGTIARVFIGSSLILYGSVTALFFLLNNRTYAGSMLLLLPVLGLRIIKGPDPEAQRKRSERILGNYDSLT